MKKILLALVTFISLTQAEDVYATFNVIAAKDAKLAFVAGGIVNSVNADIGSVVKKDTVLATLDNDDIKAMLANSKSSLKFAKRSLERQEKIKKLIDEGKFDKVLSSYENAKNAVAYQQALFEKTYLKAPFNGIIYYKNIEVGDAVSGMMLKTVFKIQSQHARKLILEFDQKYHNIVKTGQKFRYHIDGDSQEHIGSITKVYPHADISNRKLQAEVLTQDVMVGLFGDGFIEIE
ncbi:MULTISPECIES: HlyD family efflux transporter periplasmic adaptor subunit [Sulfurimonas]|uniref:efflux RND transporter periplasmic adaptor subunit n=1 Tax=Sulfurimonas TaxID=202746 RepID=UPI0012640211|nr:HlyD family efflux transporter periplasmic adaptor subunit [Sulfurimonas indica]